MVIVCVVAPFDQVFPVAKFDVKVTGLLLQIILDELVIVGIGFKLTINCNSAILEQEPVLTKT